MKIVYQQKPGTVVWEAWEYGLYESTKVVGSSKAEAIGRLILSLQPSSITLVDFDDL